MKERFMNCFRDAEQWVCRDLDGCRVDQKIKLYAKDGRVVSVSVHSGCGLSMTADEVAEAITQILNDCLRTDCCESERTAYLHAHLRLMCSIVGYKLRGLGCIWSIDEAQEVTSALVDAYERGMTPEEIERCVFTCGVAYNSRSEFCTRIRALADEATKATR